MVSSNYRNPLAALLLSVMTLGIAGCAPDELDAPLIEVREAQESTADLVDQTEAAVEKIGESLEEVKKEVMVLRVERDQLQEQLSKKETRIEELHLQLEAERQARTEVEGHLSKQTEAKEKLADELARQKQARAKDAPQPAETGPEAE